MASEKGLGARRGIQSSRSEVVWGPQAGRASGCSMHLGVEGSWGGRSRSRRTSGWVPGGGPRPGGQPGFGPLGRDGRGSRFSGDGGQSRAGPSGEQWVWAPGRKKGERDGEAPAGASLQSCVREHAKAWPRECLRAVPGSPSPLGRARLSWRLGWTWRRGWGCGSVGVLCGQPLGPVPGRGAE